MCAPRAVIVVRLYNCFADTDKYALNLECDLIRYLLMFFQKTSISLTVGSCAVDSLRHEGRTLNSIYTCHRSANFIQRDSLLCVTMSTVGLT